MSFEKSLGVHPKAMQLRLLRAELLAANLAQVNTPHFQAKDIDFVSEMQRVKLKFNTLPDTKIKYRMPYQASTDGNTVALDIEQAEFSKNALDYQTSLSFLNMKLLGLKKAIEGK
ncbi:flagellar basal body rod protein FlgB [Candidatus Fukatsuia symbiotica]